MKRILIALAMVGAFSFSAKAADVFGGFAGSTKDAPIVGYAPFSFTGFYVGAAVGAGFGNAGLDIDEVWSNGDENGRYNILSLDGLSAVGVRAGVDGEYLRDLGRVVIGLGAYYHWSNQEFEASIIDNAAGVTLENKGGYGAYIKAGLKVQPETMAYVLAGYGADEWEINGHIGEQHAKLAEYTAEGLLLGAGMQTHLGNNWHLKGQVTALFGSDQTYRLDGNDNCHTDAILGIDNYTATVGLARQF